MFLKARLFFELDEISPAFWIKFTEKEVVVFAGDVSSTANFTEHAGKHWLEVQCVLY
jgi:hypothetical protein